MTRPCRPSLAATILAATWLGSSVPVSECRAQSAEIEGLRHDFDGCHTQVDAAERLRCYDAMVSKFEPPRFHGTLADETAPFTVEAPTLLRYQSDGPVFVMDLTDARGEVVQNLHIGGGWESTYLTIKPGVYRLQISGTDTWRVWVEPAAASPHG